MVMVMVVVVMTAVEWKRSSMTFKIHLSTEPIAVGLGGVLRVSARGIL